MSTYLIYNWTAFSVKQPPIQGFGWFEKEVRLNTALRRGYQPASQRKDHPPTLPQNQARGQIYQHPTPMSSNEKHIQNGTGE
jgi:hypothetical protein